MIKYITKPEAISIFECHTCSHCDMIAQNFIISGSIYTYECFTDKHVYKIIIDVINNQLIESRYNKATDKIFTFYHNIRSNVSHLLAKRYMEFKIEKLGY